MVKKTKVLIFLLLVSREIIFSQQLSHQVLVPLAGNLTAGAYNYSQTVGETAVEIMTSTDYVFTQGFQQPGIKVAKETTPVGNGVRVYPNPVTDLLNIELFGDNSRTLTIEIINMSGIIFSTEKVVFTGQFWNILHYSMEKYARGLYFVRIISEDGLINRTFKIEKM